MGSNMKFLVVLSFAVAAQAAPQLLHGGVGIHAIPTVVKQEVKYKTAAFEPVEADTPADATLIELKETEHTYDALVPGPVTYAAAGLHLGLPYAAPCCESGAPRSEEDRAPCHHLQPWLPLWSWSWLPLWSWSWLPLWSPPCSCCCCRRESRGIERKSFYDFATVSLIKAD